MRFPHDRDSSCCSFSCTYGLVIQHQRTNTHISLILVLVAKTPVPSGHPCLVFQLLVLCCAVLILANRGPLSSSSSREFSFWKHCSCCVCPIYYVKQVNIPWKVQLIIFNSPHINNNNNQVIISVTASLYLLVAGWLASPTQSIWLMAASAGSHLLLLLFALLGCWWTAVERKLWRGINKKQMGDPSSSSSSYLYGGWFSWLSAWLLQLPGRLILWLYGKSWNPPPPPPFEYSVLLLFSSAATAIHCVVL